MSEDTLSKIAKFKMPVHLLEKIIPNSKFLHETPDKKIYIEGLSTDSRLIEKNFIFFALKGDNFDAHSFLQQVKEKKAIAAVVEKSKINKRILNMIATEFFLLVVDDVLKAFGQLAAEFRRLWHGKLLSVTGSNGKTTAKEIISNILKIEVGAESQFSTYGNQNNHIGVPLNLLRLSFKNKFAVLEMGMNHIGEIAKLSAIVKPNFSLIVNAQREHQEFLGSVRTTAKENGTVISYTSENSVVVFPKDKENEDIWWDLARKKMSKVVRFGLKNDISDFNLENNSKEVTCNILSNNPLVVELDVNGELIGSAKLNGLGVHFARTATAAVAASIALGISNKSIVKGLETFTPIKGRGYFYYLTNGSIVVDDSYNANPDSVKAAIIAMVDLRGRKAMILGDMAELGQDSEVIHQEILNLAVKHLDEVFLLGKNFTKASKNIRSGKSYLSTKKLEEDVRAWLDQSNLQKSSAVLWIKGSRASNLDLIVNSLVSV